MKKILSQGLLLPVVVLLCHCAENPVPATETKIGPIPEDEATILVSNPELAKQLEVLKLGLRPAQQTAASASFRNTGSHSLQLRIRTLFKNPQGVTIAVSAWENIRIEAGETAAYTTTTAEPHAQRILVQIEPQP